MKVVDANVLLYAINRDSPLNARAKDWLDRTLSGEEAVGYTWIVLLAFLRVATRAGLFPEPLTMAEALDVMESWLAQPPALVLEPTARHLALVRGLLQPTGTAGNLVNDAHLAAIAIEHGAEVVSFDTDFSRFEGVRLHVPPA